MAQSLEAWSKLDTLRADLLLLNEARVPVGRQDTIYSAQGTLGRDDKVRPWSAAIVSPHGAREIVDAVPSFRGHPRRVPFENSRPGSWVAAQVPIPGIGDVTCVALYGLLDEFSDSSVHRSLSDVSAIFNDDRYRDMVLLGGDLNTGTQWRPVDRAHQARDQAVLDRISAFGLVDCLQRDRLPGRLEGCQCPFGEECPHTRTRRDKRWPHIPYQADYLFASAPLAERLVSCQVLSEDEWGPFSDHLPIAAEFEWARPLNDDELRPHRVGSRPPPAEAP
jgi:hypothetical protein